MTNNLLESWFKFSVAEGGFYAIFGFLFVFIGILLLIIVITLLGKVVSQIEGKNKPKVKKEKSAPVTPAPPVTVKSNAEEVDASVVAAITAALMAYYEAQGTNCEFVVKRIRKI